MSCRATKSGLTLFEVIVAVALTVGLMGAAMGFYRQTLDYREALLERTGRTMAVRRTLERMTEELRAAVGAGRGFRGDWSRLAFDAAGLPSRAVWAVRDFTEDPLPAEQDVRRVTYRLRIEYDEEDEPYVAGFERVEQRILRQVVVEEEDPQLRQDLLSPEIRFCYFRFWDGAAWVNAWGTRDLPPAVEINLGFEPFDNDGESFEIEDYPYETVRRVVALPTAPPVTVAEEGAVRMLDTP